MLSTNLHLPKTLNPLFSSSSSQCPFTITFPNPLSQTLTLIPPLKPPRPLNSPIQSLSQNPNSAFPLRITHAAPNRNPRLLAGRSDKKPGGSSSGRIEGNAEVRREAKRNARRKSRRLAENLFYRLKNPHRSQADNFSEEELQMIGLGYDRMVRFMDQDDPNIRHPYDWYKYGQFGPYSWRGVVLGDPIRGRFTDECVSMIGEVRDQEEWEEIEQFDMATDYGKRLEKMDKAVGFRYFYVFVRHPNWRISELPWQQWTLVCEVVLEAGKQRLDKWSLMGRLGNKARSWITQCAAWMRPDIIYVERPVYQCRFEPQDSFFSAIGHLLDPSTEKNYLFELKREDGRVEMITYYGGLCKIVKVNPKAFVDDVVKAYEKLNDEMKSKCLEFLLTNHPVQLLHPYTKEYKALLEEMELGCDAPDSDDDDNDNVGAKSDPEGSLVKEWIEEDGDEDVNEDGEEDDIIDVDGSVDDELGTGEEEPASVEETEEYWDEEFKKALRSDEGMEKLARRSVEATTELYKRQLKAMKEEDEMDLEDTRENLRGRSRQKASRDGWRYIGRGPRRRKIKRSKIPPELFLRAAVRPFTYRNLVKEIVLLRHAIVDGEVSGKG
ncbi:hypothetical protein Syun_016249 [Stephania yunnanensis]|uniref:Uncharacterized protein n=1 Tax=Stephania yunnanensis TaxID=152371 RepID=A0AAP0J4G8_9MAGN